MSRLRPTSKRFRRKQRCTCIVRSILATRGIFRTVYAALHDFARSYPFNVEEEDYLIHITTGTHVAQICLFLLAEARYFPGKLVQTAPPTKWGSGPGTFDLVDLDLSKYDRLASRFAQEQRESASILKSGIETRNEQFNRVDRPDRARGRCRPKRRSC